MATRTWQGTTTDWATATNWSGSTAPLDGDDVIFPAASSQSCTANVDRTGDSAGAGLNLHSIYIAPGFGGDIGTSATPLKCMVGSGTDPSLRHYGSKPLYYDSEQGTGSAETELIIVNSANRDGAIEIGGTDTINRIIIMRGAYTLTNPLVTRFFHTFLRDAHNDTSGTISSPGAINEAGVFAGGKVNSTNTLGAPILSISNGCRFTHTAGGGGFRVHPFSLLDHRGGGTIGTLRNAGTATFENSDTETTITDLYRLTGGKLIYDEQLITITNDYDIYGV